MPKKGHSELAAGLAVVVALALALTVVVWLGAAEVFKPVKQRVFFTIKESMGCLGLTEGNFVQVNDAPVGKIVEIRLLPEKGLTLYVAQIESPDVRIYSDGAAEAVEAMLGGGKLVITSRGSNKKPLADEKHPIELTPGGLLGYMTGLSRELKGEMDKSRPAALIAKIHVITDKLTKIAANVRTETDAKKVNSLLAKIHTSLSDLNVITARIRVQTDLKVKDSVLAKVHHTMDDISASTADVKKIVAEAKPLVGKTLKHAASTAEKIDTYTKKDVAAILAKLKETTSEITKISKDISVISRQGREIIVGNRDNIDEIIDNMTAVSANLKAASKEIRRSPWRLLHKPKEGERRSDNLRQAAWAFCDGAEQLDQAIAKLKTLDPKSPDRAKLEKVRKSLQETVKSFGDIQKALWNEVKKGQ